MLFDNQLSSCHIRNSFQFSAHIVIYSTHFLGKFTLLFCINAHILLEPSCGTSINKNTVVKFWKFSDLLLTKGAHQQTPCTFPFGIFTQIYTCTVVRLLALLLTFETHQQKTFKFLSKRISCIMNNSGKSSTIITRSPLTSNRAFLNYLQRKLTPEFYVVVRDNYDQLALSQMEKANIMAYFERRKRRASNNTYNFQQVLSQFEQSISSEIEVQTIAFCVIHHTRQF